MNISELVGKTFTSVTRNDDGVKFLVDDDTGYELMHLQDCCESVYLEDITGDLQDLVGTPILKATEDFNQDDDSNQESQTWSFYTIVTIKGYVSIRWYGSSNGYYSETADLYTITKRGK